MFRRLLLAGASLALVLAVAEAAIRVLGLAVDDRNGERSKIADFQILHPEGDYFYYPPGSSVEFWGSTTTFNSFGMRDVEPAPARTPGTCRIVLLGDSVTMGEDVPQSQIFPYRMRELFAGRPVEIVAAGMTGWNSAEEERFLRTNLERLDPDVVSLLYVLNDFEPYNSLRRELEQSKTATDRVVETLVLRSRLFEWMFFAWRKAVGPNLEQLGIFGRWNELLTAAGPPFAPASAGWIESRDALLRMRDQLAARGAKLVVYLHRLGINPLEKPALERLNEFSRESGVPFFDTLPFYEGHSWKSIVNDPTIDSHLNAEGHALLARGMARSLEQAGLLDCGADRAAPK